MHKWIFFVRATPLDNTVRKNPDILIIEKLFNDHIGMVDADSQTAAIGIEEYEAQLQLKRTIRQ